jgi:hypothetical protein
MPDDVKRELDEAIERILASKSPKRLVVAGPGAGKTTVFRKLLDGSAGSADDRLVIIEAAKNGRQKPHRYIFIESLDVRPRSALLCRPHRAGELGVRLGLAANQSSPFEVARRRQAKIQNTRPARRSSACG